MAAPNRSQPGAARTGAPPGAAEEVTIDQAFEIATRMHKDGQLDQAGTLYGRILMAMPAHAGAANALGMLRHQRGDSAEAQRLIQQAIALAPEDAGFHNNLGNLHLECGRVEEAIAAYRRAAELAPGSVMVQNNLGHVLREEGRYTEARACFLMALQIDPQFVRAIVNLGLVGGAEGQFDTAVACYRRALEIEPDRASVQALLARTLLRMQRFEEAAEVYRKLLELRPDDPVARHMAAAITGADVPTRAGDAYVETLFDHFAGSFDSVLTERLGYRAPQLCADLVARLFGAPAGRLEVLDAGCGTGLCGPLLKPWARQLHGVDLSKGMLDKAHQRGSYHGLYKAELTQFLRDSSGQWDLVVSADTLCYFGDLADVLAATSTALKPGAPIVFTVEAVPAGETRDHVIQPHGRYAHSDAYLKRLFATLGLEPLALEAAVLRYENAQPVNGWVVAARRPAAEAAAPQQPH